MLTAAAAGGATAAAVSALFTQRIQERAERFRRKLVHVTVLLLLLLLA